VFDFLNKELPTRRPTPKLLLQTTLQILRIVY